METDDPPQSGFEKEGEILNNPPGGAIKIDHLHKTNKKNSHRTLWLTQAPFTFLETRSNPPPFSIPLRENR